ncbi:MAG TPA: ribonuclease HII [archaeon]|nr:ribonuclease HII [archaeon]
MIIAGVDEAGRGPVLGPMVMSIACIDKAREDELRGIGVRDSKQLLPSQRERQFPLIKNALSEFQVIEIKPRELDALMIGQSLNEIEARYVARMVNSLKQRPDVLYLDSPDSDGKKFARRVQKYLADKSIEVISENKADDTYVIVSAASVLAKVTRDNAMRELEREYGEFGAMGSGYPADPVTMAFLENWIKHHKRLPEFARHMWNTSTKALDNGLQEKLF